MKFAHTSTFWLQYTKSCDIWSIGVITYILLCGYPPFYGDSDTEIFDSVRTGRFEFPSPEWDTISTEAKDFVTFLIHLDPDSRYGCLCVRMSLVHNILLKSHGRFFLGRLPDKLWPTIGSPCMQIQSMHM